MAKGSYDISVSSHSNVEEEEKNNNENRECLNNCLSPAFLRSLSLYDRPRSSQVPTNKELCKSRYRALVSSSLEKIPSNSSPPAEARSECRTNHTSESVGINADVEVTTQQSSSSDAHPGSVQYQLAEPDSWLDDKYRRFSMESEKILEKTVAILRTVNEDISASFTSLTKPESITLESLMKIYKNEGRRTAGCSAVSGFDFTTKSFSDHIYENWQPPFLQKPKDIQAHSTQHSPKNTLAHSTQQSPENKLVDSTQESPKNTVVRSTKQSPINTLPHSTQGSPKNTLAHSTRLSPKNKLSDSIQQSSKNTLVHSTQQSPKNTLAHSPEETLKNFEFLSNSEDTQSKPFSGDVPSFDHHIYENWLPSFQKRSKDIQADSTSERPKILHSHSPRQNSKHTQADSTHQSPKISKAQTLQSPVSFLAPSAQETLNFESLDSKSENPVPDSGDVRSVEQNPENLVSSNKSLPDDTTEVKSRFDFDLPTDHEQFIKIIGALQNRCLEYREMIQDITFYALEECLNFSECSISRIRNLRRQFESQKMNFRDFKELCGKSVIFGSESQPINEKVTEVIQSFYLMLMQEENETFMARLEFGLKMSEVYTKMLKLEKESKKIIITLEKEILYLKKTSVGFKV